MLAGRDLNEKVKIGGNLNSQVDLKTFASWEDSPEKMMMDMMGNPNAVGREER